MQKRNEEAFGDIQGVHVIADDLIISEKDEAEHDAIISRVLERARQQNAKLLRLLGMIKYLAQYIQVSRA